MRRDLRRPLSPFRRRLVLFVGLIGVLLLAGCQSPTAVPPPATSPTASVAAAAPTVVTALPTFVTVAPAGIPPVVGEGLLAVVPRGASSSISPATASLGQGWTATAFVRPDADRDLAVRLQVVERPNRADRAADAAVAFELQLFDAGTGQSLSGRPVTLGVRPPSGVDLARLVPYQSIGTDEQQLPWSVPPDADAVLFSGATGTVVVVATAPPSGQQAAAATSAPLVRAPLPSRVTIPAIGIDAPVVPVGLEPSGIMASPPDGHLIGWYEPGPRPGEPSNAVLDGHADWSGKPAVFWRLKELKAGDEIFVRAGPELRFRFVVSDVRQHRAEEAPLAEVFGPTPRSVLTLITCGGVFDYGRREYEDRIVVRADGA